jgi:hypothetical protein
MKKIIKSITHLIKLYLNNFNLIKFKCNNYYSQDFTNKLKKIFNQINIRKEKNSPSFKNKIIFVPGFCHSESHAVFASLISMILSIKNIHIKPLIMNDFFTGETHINGGNYGGIITNSFRLNHRKIETELWKNLCKFDLVILLKFFRPWDYFIARKITKNLTINNFNEVTFENYRVGHRAVAAVNHLSRAADINQEKNYSQSLKFHAMNIVKEYLCVDRMLKKEKPSAIVSYSAETHYHWEIIKHLAKKNNIPYYVYGFGEKKGSIFLGDDSKCMLDGRESFLEFYNRQNFNDAKKNVDEIMNMRIHGKFSGFYIRDYSSNHQQKINEIKNWANGRKIFLYAGNDLTDDHVLNDCPAFSSLFEMLLKTIEFFNQNPQICLIIKAHPAEREYYESKNPEWIKACLKEVLNFSKVELNDNIKFIDYNTDIHAINLIEIVDCGLIASSTLALDMVYMKKPVINTYESHYTNLGFTYDVKSQKEYFDYILKISKSDFLLNEDEFKIAIIYLFYYYNFLQISSSLFDSAPVNTGEIMKPKLNIDNIDTLIEHKNKLLDYAITSIVNNERIFAKNRFNKQNFNE